MGRWGGRTSPHVAKGMAYIKDEAIMGERRYVPRRGYVDWDGETKVSPTVSVIVDDGFVKTGLLDANGTPLYRTIGLIHVVL